ncbi:MULTISPECIES: helix-turn-helix domain-containing protein [Veillonella]|uniref:helix-turn-helix domain-containing protein n=1 Tax=Veillonella infantium TaxID=1911679 RepID=UPI001CAE7A97|nr:helix-turn-helix transcriptional regulator [Veillonella infantium]MBF1214951.1 helix-turn-helix transcriptional regulator [Fusobacterium periodonticum]
MNKFKVRSGVLEKIMQEKFLSVLELSKISGLSRPSLYSIINEKVSYVRVANCKKLAEALKVSVEDIFYVENSNR